MRYALSWLLWPCLLGAALSVTAWGMTTSLPLLWLNLSYFGLALAVFALERAMPHEAAWNRNDGQLWPDIGHTLLSKTAVQALIIIPALLGAGALSASDSGGWWPDHWPLVLQVLLGLAIAEFGFYWAHRLCHEIRMLWRFHAVHHSVTRLWFVNTGRFHFVDTLISVSFGLGLALAVGMPHGVIVWVSAVTAFVGLLTHANVEMRFGPLNYVFNTPELHRWHHSRRLEEGNRNYGENLIVFDILFGTHYVSPRRPPVDIGIDEPMPDTLGAQIAWPFRRDDDAPAEVSV